jgi:hypothetical protein
MELQLDATITVFIDLQDQLNMFRANFCPSSGAQDLVFFTTYGIMSCYVVGRGFWAWCLSLRTRSDKQHPEDGQKFARNMLSWPWRSIKNVIVASSWSSIFTLHTKNKFKILLEVLFYAMEYFKYILHTAWSIPSSYRSSNQTHISLLPFTAQFSECLGI